MPPHRLPMKKAYDTRIPLPHIRHFERTREIFFVPFSYDPSLSLLGEAPPPSFRNTVLPFPAVKHSPSYRQRKRSLDCARDDKTGKRFFPFLFIPATKANLRPEGAEKDKMFCRSL